MRGITKYTNILTNFLRRMCNPCGFTMEMRFRYHILLIHDIERNTETDGMGPFNTPNPNKTFLVIKC